MPEGLLQSLIKLMPSLQRLGVTSLCLFGSAARGEMSDKSDIDILVEFDSLDANRFFEVLFILEDILERKVDLVLPETLHPRIRDKVLQEAIRVA